MYSINFLVYNVCKAGDQNMSKNILTITYQLNWDLNTQNEQTKRSFNLCMITAEMYDMNAINLSPGK